jgi:hypothetical protein
MKLTIETVNNGLILTVPFDDGERTADSRYVFDFGNGILSSNKRECESIQDMFYQILEEIKPNSKHNPYRIDIEVKEQNND